MRHTPERMKVKTVVEYNLTNMHEERRRNKDTREDMSRKQQIDVLTDKVAVTRYDVRKSNQQ